MRTTLIILFLFTILLKANSKDNLILTGTVENINNNFIEINVKSSSCPGKRKFKISSPLIITKIKEGDSVLFLINSASCKSDNIEIIGVWKK